MKETQLSNLLKLKQKAEDEEGKIVTTIDLSKKIKNTIENNKEKIKNHKLIIQIINNNLKENLQKKNEVENKKKFINNQIEMMQTKKRIAIKKGQNKPNKVIIEKKEVPTNINFTKNATKDNSKIAKRKKQIITKIHVKKDKLSEKNNKEKLNIEKEIEAPRKKKSIYEQAYEDMIRRNGPISKWLNDGINEQEKKSNSNIENKIFSVHNIELKEQKSERYIKINERKFSINRCLDKDTKIELDEIYKKLLKENKKINILKKLNIYTLKQKVDPAIINGIKEYLMEYLNKCNYDIEKYGNVKSLKIDVNTKELEKMYDKAINAEDAKVKAKSTYRNLLEQYVKSIYLSEKVKVPFNLIYDCTGKIDIKEYKNIMKYIYYAKKIGATINKNLFGIFKETIDNYKSNETHVTTQYLEGDKSFIPKVKLDMATIPAKKNNINYIKQKQISL